MKNRKNRIILLVVVLLTTFTGCEDVFVDLSEIEVKDEHTDDTYTEWLSWSSDEAEYGIGFPDGGIYSVAARWDAEQLKSYGSNIRITKMSYVIGDDGYNKVIAKIWAGGAAESLLWSKDVTETIQIDKWNVVELEESLALNFNEDIWVGYTIWQKAGKYPAVVDNGPAVAGYGDMLLVQGNQLWERLSDNLQNYNWCVKMLVEGDLEGATPTETFTDPRDGQSYEIVEIGNQTWFAENLNYDDPFSSWWYNNDGSNGDVYGRLYNWAAAKDACPDGWHLPSDEEWKQLEIALGMSQDEADADGWRGTDEGQKMKSATGWYQNGNGSNSSGLNLRAGGYRDSSPFHYMGKYGYYWTSSSYSSTNVWVRFLSYDRSKVDRANDGRKTFGFSVRCVKD